MSHFLILLILALIHNIYMRKKVENALQLTLQQSKLAEIGEIFSSIAHQWKTPLIEITAIAQEKFILGNSSQKEDESYVKDIMTQVKYMNDTIENFQQFIMPSNKKIEFNVFDAIKDMLNIVDHNMKYSYIDISLRVNENTNLLILGYKNEFMQSILNIINNAKDELIKQDIKNRCIKINIFNEGKKLVIAIEDNAGGIKAKNIYDIFKAYNSTKEHGHGIGLYMAKMIIEDKMGGFILVYNTKNGAYFKIMLG
jgi:C4-dicarboxylate-specific signal transduction histidine kinase